MTSFLIAGLCIAASGCLVALLDRWCRRARVHDLTRPSEYLDQATRQHDNARAFEDYLARCEARNVPRIRPLPEDTHA